MTSRVQTITADWDWARSAACAQIGTPDAWHPDTGGATRQAMRMCARCTVQAECLQYALDTNQEHGIWGGLPPRTRRKLKLQQAAA